MSQDMVLVLVRGLGFILVIGLIGIALRFIVRQIIAKDADTSHAMKNTSTSNSGTVVSHSEFRQDDASTKHKTSRLNPSFFVSIHKENKQKSPTEDVDADEPLMNLPLTIMARHGKHFTGSEVEDLFYTFGLKRSPNHAYELITAKGNEILFTALNVRKPGIFPQDFSTLEKVEGLLLILQLPVGKDPVKALETFLAMASEMSDSIDGRLCDHNRRPMGEKDILNYRRAADEFDRQYSEWLAKYQR